MEGFSKSSEIETLRQELSDGLLYIHARLSENTQSTLEAASFLYALVELLNEQGLISIDQLDQRKSQVATKGSRGKILKRVSAFSSRSPNTTSILSRVRRRSTAKTAFTCARPLVVVCRLRSQNRIFARISFIGISANLTLSSRRKTAIALISIEAVKAALYESIGRCLAAPTTAAKIIKSGSTLTIKSSIPTF